MSIPNGVVCLISALSDHAGILDRPSPRIKKSKKGENGHRKNAKHPPWANRNPNRERTVVDSFRDLSREFAIKALQAYLRQTSPNKRNLSKLMKYAKSLRYGTDNMKKGLKQSIKERLHALAKERNLTFAEIWHNLILERFLARLCQSKYKANFILLEMVGQGIEGDDDQEVI